MLDRCVRGNTMFDARYLVDGASEAAIAIDGRLRIVACNHMARRLLDRRRREIIGRSCADVLQAVRPDGQLLCSRDCTGGHCFLRGQPFAVPTCRVRRGRDSWITVELASVAIPRRLRGDDARNGVAAIFLRHGDSWRYGTIGDGRLQIFAFGRFDLAVGGHQLPVETWQRRQALTLLKLLVAHGARAVSRDFLIDCLWPNAEVRSARGRLKVVLYYLRRQLRGAGVDGDVVETAGDGYVLRRDAVWIDADEFAARVVRGRDRERRQDWAEAADQYDEARRLYRGPYLGEDMHAEWCAAERDRLREIYLEMLAGLAECQARLGRHPEAVAACQAALAEDPCREDAHRALMRNLARLGNIDAAIAQYRQCQRTLSRELDVEPMPETRELFRRIVAGDAGAAAAVSGRAAE